ncbi:hypothetical protein FA048_08095 [Pedobacter polaris]|uniref:Uncharacterized protein n=1 Tax=Pedobacter polaris TaxID=2571273 RepID=A0A4V5NZV8_9SPHI|nr:hypothetical protein [Pedobacter polaris]TKC10152.1 hypothetical protein FA048_08095 [Pedobacter polaris]
MENSNQENKDTQNPKPTDQVQLEIETVTPETEIDVPALANTNKQPSENDTTGLAEGEAETKDKNIPQKTASISTEGGEVATETPDKKEEQVPTDKGIPSEKLEGDSPKDHKDEDDERNQVETVSP